MTQRSCACGRQFGASHLEHIARSGAAAQGSTPPGATPGLALRCLGHIVLGLGHCLLTQMMVCLDAVC